MSRKDPSKRTRDIVRRLEEEGWKVDRRRGDHVQYKHPTKPGRVTIDNGAREQTTGTLRSIFRQAGWEW